MRTATRILDIARAARAGPRLQRLQLRRCRRRARRDQAALHYHFPGKGELGRALIERYTERFLAARADIDERVPDAPAKLSAYAGLYAEVLRGNRMCLCGMLAAEYQTLPDPMREAVLAFIDANETWVEKVLDRDGAPAPSPSPALAATLRG